DEREATLPANREELSHVERPLDQLFGSPMQVVETLVEYRQPWLLVDVGLVQGRNVHHSFAQTRGQDEIGLYRPAVRTGGCRFVQHSAAGPAINHRHAPTSFQETTRCRHAASAPGTKAEPVGPGWAYCRA